MTSITDDKPNIACLGETDGGSDFGCGGDVHRVPDVSAQEAGGIAGCEDVARAVGEDGCLDGRGIVKTRSVGCQNK